MFKSGEWILPKNLSYYESSHLLPHVVYSSSRQNNSAWDTVVGQFFNIMSKTPLGLNCPDLRPQQCPIVGFLQHVSRPFLVCATRFMPLKSLRNIASEATGRSTSCTKGEVVLKVIKRCTLRGFRIVQIPPPRRLVPLLVTIYDAFAFAGFFVT